MMKQKKERFLQLLQEGDLRTTGDVNKAVEMVEKEPSDFDELFSLIDYPDSGVRLRASDAIEKLTAKNKSFLTDIHKQVVLKRFAFIDQQEVQWHIAQIIPRLPLQKSDIKQVELIFNKYLLNTKSNIVRVNTLQALADLALQEKLEKAKAVRAIELCIEEIGTPSIKARAKKLLKILSK